MFIFLRSGGCSSPFPAMFCSGFFGVRTEDSWLRLGCRVRPSTTGAGTASSPVRLIFFFVFLLLFVFVLELGDGDSPVVVLVTDLVCWRSVDFYRGCGVRRNVKLLMLVADLKVGFGFQSSDDGFGVLCIFRVCFRCLLVATNLLLAANLATQWVFSDEIQRCGGGGWR
jgi:hypothetical protein